MQVQLAAVRQLHSHAVRAAVIVVGRTEWLMHVPNEMGHHENGEALLIL